MVLRLLAATCFLLSLTRADVKFITPTAGSIVSGSSLSAAWEESGIYPPITNFESYSLFLCAGGNSDADYIALADLDPYDTFASGLSWKGPINSGWGANNTNAYFLKMIGSVCGGTVTNYSPRFSISSMTGSFPLNVIDAIQALDQSNTEGPPTLDTNLSSSMCKSSPIPSTTANSASASASASATTTSTVLAGPSSSNSSNTSAAGSAVALSRSGIVGLIVGVVVGLVLVSAIALTICIYRRRRRSKAGDGSETTPGNFFMQSGRRPGRGALRLSSTDAVNELSAQAVCKELDADNTRIGRQEIVGTPISELPARKSMKSIYEMAAD